MAQAHNDQYEEEEMEGDELEHGICENEVGDIKVNWREEAWTMTSLICDLMHQTRRMKGPMKMLMRIS
jgi:hypothetical protein